MSLVRSTAPRTAQISWHRLGDAALAAVFVVFALGPLVRALSATADLSLLVALNKALVAVTALIVAALVLSRRKAHLSTVNRVEQIAAIVGTFAMLPLGWLRLTWHPDWLLELLTVGFVLAYVWILWALLTLKNSFSVFPEARRLVREGPYRFVRHPLYFAYFFTYSMIMLPRISVVAVAVTAIGIAAEVYRSRCEERVLRKAFPEYDAYAREVRAFVPFNRAAR